MSFLQRLIKNTFRDGQTRGQSSFANLSEDELETHLGIAKYGKFLLTDAVRPSYDLQVVPRAGFRHDKYRDDETGTEIPVVMGAASSQHVLDLFFDLMDPLGATVDVVLESSHETAHGQHRDLIREGIDTPVLKSILYDYEDLLLHDGCLGIAVMNPLVPAEVQLDEHKLLIAYGKDLRNFEYLFGDYGIACDEELRFITEAEHVHSSSEAFIDRFRELKYDLGIDN